IKIVRALLMFLFSAAAAICQDARTVPEPSFPPVCSRLPALMTTVVESAPDTARIQGALNACPAGESVALDMDGTNRVFVMGPIQLPKGVTLIVDAGVTVYASRNPRDYDSDSRHVCGTLQTSGSGCLPLILARRADGAGLMGYGTIDGRGHLP